jgi:hypothetical protein
MLLAKWPFLAEQVFVNGENYLSKHGGETKFGNAFMLTVPKTVRSLALRSPFRHDMAETPCHIWRALTCLISTQPPLILGRASYP